MPLNLCILEIRILNGVYCLNFSNTEPSVVLNHTYMDILLYVEMIIEVMKFCFIAAGKSTSSRASWAPPWTFYVLCAEATRLRRRLPMAGPVHWLMCLPNMDLCDAEHRVVMKGKTFPSASYLEIYKLTVGIL